jgi:hypothetical protein
MPSQGMKTSANPSQFRAGEVSRNFVEVSVNKKRFPDLATKNITLITIR